MNLVCAAHPRIDAVARCVRCGVHLCDPCRAQVGLKSFCSNCHDATRPEAAVIAPAAASSAVVVPVQPAPLSPRQPWLAATLSLVPGLGQVYAGRLLRGALFFGAAIALRDAPWMSPLLAAYLHVFNLFDAYRLAQRRTEATASTRFDECLFLVLGLGAIAFSLTHAGGIADAPRSTFLPLAGLAATLLLAHETRR